MFASRSAALAVVAAPSRQSQNSAQILVERGSKSSWGRGSRATTEDRGESVRAVSVPKQCWRFAVSSALTMRERSSAPAANSIVRNSSYPFRFRCRYTSQQACLDSEAARQPDLRCTVDQKSHHHCTAPTLCLPPTMTPSKRELGWAAAKHRSREANELRTANICLFGLRVADTCVAKELARVRA